MCMRSCVRTGTYWYVLASVKYMLVHAGAYLYMLICTSLSYVWKAAETAMKKNAVRDEQARRYLDSDTRRRREADNLKA